MFYSPAVYFDAGLVKSLYVLSRQGFEVNVKIQLGIYQTLNQIIRESGDQELDFLLRQLLSQFYTVFPAEGNEDYTV